MISVCHLSFFHRNLTFLCESCLFFVHYFQNFFFIDSIFFLNSDSELYLFIQNSDCFHKNLIFFSDFLLLSCGLNPLPNKCFHYFKINRLVHCAAIVLVNSTHFYNVSTPMLPHHFCTQDDNDHSIILFQMFFLFFILFVGPRPLTLLNAPTRSLLKLASTYSRKFSLTFQC